MNNNHKVVVYVRLKDGVLDPQGVTIRKALGQMGYDEFESVKTGHFFELEVKGDAKNIDSRVKEVCSKLLVNPIIERFEVEKI
ncbi:MAG: phosphoribosylformylglycinamidine synthase subunit PurS [candidate division Zixibacteria bacterium]|nr:phosphoribosylformylglycinamidine synthase subunit PurS [candidate division Zixibacteria bacterium]